MKNVVPNKHHFYVLDKEREGQPKMSEDNELKELLAQDFIQTPHELAEVLEVDGTNLYESHGNDP